VPTLRHFVCIDAETDGDTSLEKFMQQGEAAEEVLSSLRRLTNPYTVRRAFFGS